MPSIPKPEGSHLIGNGATDVEPVRLRKKGPMFHQRVEYNVNARAFRKNISVRSDLSCRGSKQDIGWSNEAKAFIDRRFEQCRVRAQFVKCAGIEHDRDDARNCD